MVTAIDECTTKMKRCAGQGVVLPDRLGPAVDQHELQHVHVTKPASPISPSLSVVPSDDQSQETGQLDKCPQSPHQMMDFELGLQAKLMATNRRSAVEQESQQQEQPRQPLVPNYVNIDSLVNEHLQQLPSTGLRSTASYAGINCNDHRHDAIDQQQVHVQQLQSLVPGDVNASLVNEHLQQTHAQQGATNAGTHQVESSMLTRSFTSIQHPRQPQGYASLDEVHARDSIQPVMHMYEQIDEYKIDHNV